MDMGSSSMNMGTSTMSMSMSTTGTATATAASASSTGMSMSMGGSGANACKISMLWNWYSVDACFIAKSWHVTSKGMFAGTCIGVILLVIALEALRRLAKEYDALILRQHISRTQSTTTTHPTGSVSDSENNGKSSPTTLTRNIPITANCQTAFRPSVLQQAIRALLHMVQFAVAYFVMLLAMYYNGYIIICIFIGAYIGAFIFSWQSIGLTGKENTNANEVTYCCG